MEFRDISKRGMVLLGCGKMGGAMLDGWLRGGLDPAAIWVIDPKPSDRLKSLGMRLNEDLPEAPAVAIIAVKPQIMNDALPTLKPLGRGETVFLSIAAGTTISHISEALGDQTPIIRAMPNTPAAVGRGITALVGNSHVSEDAMAMAESLLSAVGQTVRLSDEDQMDAVTAVSGSGPAYVFHLIETMAAAGEQQGLPPELSLRLARATVAGAGALAETSETHPRQLRIDVTSPNGTTQAALEVLMDESSGFPALLGRAVAAAAGRSRELGQ